MVAKSVALPPPDADVPALHVLLGPDARDLLSAALAAADLRVRRFEVSQVRYVPGRSVTVQYRVDTVSDQGKPASSTFVAMSGMAVPDHVPVLGADDMEISFWQFPKDPFLPGLEPASDAAGVGRLLESLGAEPQEYSLRTRAYRAGRRAVIEAQGASQRVFLKVVRPDRTRRLHESHTALAEHVPVPHSFGWSEDQGIVALQAMPGRTLRAALTARSTRLPSAAALLGLLDRFPTAGPSTSAVAGPHETAPGHARLLRTVAPVLAQRLDAILSSLRSVAAEGRVAVHGDFHASQILIDKSAVVGLVDVDTAGVGERSNDLAGLLGQLSTLALTSPARRDMERYGSAVIEEFDRHVDPAGLRLRTAAMVLGLATGPFRVQAGKWLDETEQRVRLAERWVESAEKAVSSL